MHCKFKKYFIVIFFPLKHMLILENVGKQSVHKNFS